MKNYPVLWQGQSVGVSKKYPTKMPWKPVGLRKDLFICMAFYGMAGANNDINVLDNSPWNYRSGQVSSNSFTVATDQSIRGVWCGVMRCGSDVAAKLGDSQVYDYLAPLYVVVIDADRQQRSSGEIRTEVYEEQQTNKQQRSLNRGRRRATDKYRFSREIQTEVDKEQTDSSRQIRQVHSTESHKYGDEREADRQAADSDSRSRFRQTEDSERGFRQSR
ncbi:ALP1-like protein [Tanacetum coccineum]